MKKNVNKKQKTKKNNKDLVKSNLFNNKRNIILIGISILIVALLLFLFLFNFNKTIECTKTIGEKSILVENKSTIIKLSGNKIKNVNLNKTLTFGAEYISYIDIVKEALEKEYENLNIDSDITRRDSKLIISLKSSEKKLLDSVDVSLENNTININVISSDDFNDTQISKETDLDDIKKYFGQKGYTCK